MSLGKSELRLALPAVALSLIALACNLTGGEPASSAPTQRPLPPTPTDFQVMTDAATEFAATANAPLPVGNALEVGANDSLVIGILGSQSGQTAAASAAVQAGVEAALQDHEPVAGWPVELVQFDSSCSEEGGVDAAQQAVNTDNLVAVIGPTCSKAAPGALPVLESDEVVTVSASATLPDVPSYGPTVFNRVILHEGQPGSRDGAEAEGLASVQTFYERVDSSSMGDYRYFSAYGYDAASLLMQSIERVAVRTEGGGLIIDRAALARQVRVTAGFEGVTGAITFDNTGNRVP